MVDEYQRLQMGPTSISDSGTLHQNQQFRMSHEQYQRPISNGFILFSSLASQSNKSNPKKHQILSRSSKNFENDTDRIGERVSESEANRSSRSSKVHYDYKSEEEVLM